MRHISKIRLIVWVAAVAAAALLTWVGWQWGGGFGLRLGMVVGAPSAALLFIVVDFWGARHAGMRQERALAAALEAVRLAETETSALRQRYGEEQKRYAALLESQTDVVSVRGGDSCLRYANPPFYACFGGSDDTALGKPFAPELHPDCRDSVSERFARLERGETCLRGEQRIKTVQGWRWFLWQDRFVRDGDGRTLEIQSIGRDIDAYKDAQTRLQDETRQAVAENKAKTAFLMAMSREIRATVNGMSGLVKLLLTTTQTPEQQTYTQAVLQSAEILTNLTGDILDSAKIEAGNLELIDERVALIQVIEDLAELFGPRAHAKGIELVSVIAPNVPKAIFCDARRLRQVLTNLIGVAIKVTQTGGVRLDVSRQMDPSAALRFCISDTATTVDEAWRTGVRRAFAADTDTQSFEGTHLGLAVSQRLVVAMGGEIGFAESEDGGNVFWFEIPEKMAEPALPPSVTLSGLRIGVIVANPVLRHALASLVHYAGGEAASLTLEGLRAANILLVDTGTDADAAALIAPVPNIPTIVLLPPAARPNLPQLRAEGYGGYLVKPVRLSSLIERVLVCDRLGAQMRTAKALMARPKL